MRAIITHSTSPQGAIITSRAAQRKALQGLTDPGTLKEVIAQKTESVITQYLERIFPQIDAPLWVYQYLGNTIREP